MTNLYRLWAHRLSRTSERSDPTDFHVFSVRQSCSGNHGKLCLIVRAIRSGIAKLVIFESRSAIIFCIVSYNLRVQIAAKVLVELLAAAYLCWNLCINPGADGG